MPSGEGPFKLLRKHETKLRFLVVGAWNTLFGYLAFVLLNSLFSHCFPAKRLSYMLAMILGNIVAILNAFIFHKYITFRSHIGGLAMFSELARFSSTYLFTFLLSLFLLPAFIEILGLSANAAGALVILVCTVISYLGHSRFSFRNTAL